MDWNTFFAASAVMVALLTLIGTWVRTTTNKLETRIKETEDRNRALETETTIQKEKIKNIETEHKELGELKTVVTKMSSDFENYIKYAKGAFDRMADQINNIPTKS